MAIRKPVLLDMVALLRDIPEERLQRGDVGTVVEMFSDPDFVLVEFSNSVGEMTAMPTLAVADLLVLRQEMAAAE